MFLFLLHLLIRDLRRSWQNLLRLVYNALFMCAVQMFVRLQETPPPSLCGAAAASLFSAIQNITFNGDLQWAASQLPEVQAQIALLAFLASGITVYAVLLAFFGRFVRQLGFRLGGLFRRRHYVLVGSATDAMRLGDDIRAQVGNPHIVYIPTERLPNDAEVYRTFRVEAADDLTRLGRCTEYEIVLLPQAGLENLELLGRLNDAAKEKKRIRASAILDNDTLRFHDIHTDGLDALVLSVEQLAVSRFFEREAVHPLTLLRETQGLSGKNGLPWLSQTYEVCVIGFGPLGQEYLLASYERAPFLTRDEQIGFRALVIDPKMGEKRDDFLTNVPFFLEGDRVAFVEAPIGSAAYYQALEPRLGTLRQILVSTGDAAQNVTVAWNLCRYLDRLGRYQARPQIVVVGGQAQESAALRLADYAENIFWINPDREILNYETLLARKLDAAARETDQVYNRRSGKQDRWNSLGSLMQASNRAVARDREQIRTLAALCDEAAGVTEEEKLTFLAKYEHSRWCAFYHAHGWRRLPLEDLTDAERAAYKTKRTKEKLHTCLIPWEELDRVPQKSPGQVRAYDIDNVLIALGKKAEPDC
ncbi:MAG: hypothetical protein IKQ54_00040 [Oscillospiraceae bacterium]|nr:hypothetical protein [Oscillospiraceae bacterium]